MNIKKIILSVFLAGISLQCQGAKPKPGIVRKNSRGGVALGSQQKKIDDIDIYFDLIKSGREFDIEKAIQVAKDACNKANSSHDHVKILNYLELLVEQNLALELADRLAGFGLICSNQEIIDAALDLYVALFKQGYSGVRPRTLNQD